MRTRIYIVFLLQLFLIGISKGQQPLKNENLILNNMKRMTDGNVQLSSVYSSYDFPYYVPSREDIEEKLTRIATYLEKCTAKSIADSQTGITITSYSDLKRPFDMAESDYRILKYTWGVTYTGMLKAYNATGKNVFKEYVLQRFQLLSNVLPSVEQLIKNTSGYRSQFNEIVNPKNLDQSGAMCAAMVQWSRSGLMNFSFQKYIDNYSDLIFNRQYRLDDGTFARKAPYESTLWLDDLYVSIPALSYCRYKNKLKKIKFGFLVNI